MMLDTALLKRLAGLNGSPGGKEPTVQPLPEKLTWMNRNFFCTPCLPPFSFSISSCRWRISSQILCSMVLLPTPKLRKVDKAKRRCFFHTSPLLVNRPPRNMHAEELELMVNEELIFTQHERANRLRCTHLIFLSRFFH